MQTADKPKMFPGGEYLLRRYFSGKNLTERMSTRKWWKELQQGPHSGHKAATEEKGPDPHLVIHRDPQLSGKKSKRWIFNAIQFVYSKQQENDPTSVV